MAEDDEIGREAAERMLARRMGDPMVAEEIAACIRDYTAARGVDVWAVDIEGHSISEWADMTDRNRRTVRRNIERANQTDAERRAEAQRQADE
jgi:DNA-directed RNA polymerase specialized sigma24 family protein